jgi:hypothetical protein
MGKEEMHPRSSSPTCSSAWKSAIHGRVTFQCQSVLSVSLATNVFIFIVTSSEIRSIQATRNNPQSTMSRNPA